MAKKTQTRTESNDEGTIQFETLIQQRNWNIEVNSGFNEDEIKKNDKNISS